MQDWDIEGAVVGWGAGLVGLWEVGYLAGWQVLVREQAWMQVASVYQLPRT